MGMCEVEQVFVHRAYLWCGLAVQQACREHAHQSECTLAPHRQLRMRRIQHGCLKDKINLSWHVICQHIWNQSWGFIYACVFTVKCSILKHVFKQIIYILLETKNSVLARHTYNVIAMSFPKIVSHFLLQITSFSSINNIKPHWRNKPIGLFEDSGPLSRNNVATGILLRIVTFAGCLAFEVVLVVHFRVMLPCTQN